MRTNLFAVVLLLAMVYQAPALDYDEGIDGDLSDNYLAPTMLSLDPGSNFLTGSLAGGTSDLDMFTLAVPGGNHLSAIFITDFTGGGAGSFLGFQPGTTLSSPPSSSFPDAIGFAIITPAMAAVDQDVLPTIVVGPPFFGSNPLPAGDYAGWLNETGAGSTYGINFFVEPIPEPSACALIITGLIVLRTLRRAR